MIYFYEKEKISNEKEQAWDTRTMKGVLELYY